MIQPRGATNLRSLLTVLAEQFSAAIAIVNDRTVIAEYGFPADGYDGLVATFSEEIDYVQVGAQDSFHLARGSLPANNATLLVGRIHDGFSEPERQTVQAIAHVLDLGMTNTERRTPHTNAILDKEFGASDTLTGLLTRDGFTDYLELSMSDSHGPNSVLVVGLDGFKVANDTLGYATGDVVLQTVASRIQTCIRDGDVAARIGGDIFAIYSPGIGPDLAADVARRLQQSISQRIPVGESDLIVTASVGVGSAELDVAARTLVANADTAMRSAKSQGQGLVEYFDEELRVSVQRKRSLATELQDAIGKNQLASFMEPIVSISTMTVVGHEARVRWQHPTRGPLDSEEFMNIAADIGRVADVERSVFTFALQEHFRDPELPPTSVNLSSSSLFDPRYIEWMVEQLELMQISGEHLIIEVSESSIAGRSRAVQDNLDRLRAVGVGVVLDNFGTAAGSIRSFHDYQFDGVKLHPALLAGVGRLQMQSILQSVYTSSDVLGFDVIHIGVDSKDQLDALAGFAPLLHRETIFAQGAAIRDQVAR